MREETAEKGMTYMMVFSVFILVTFGIKSCIVHNSHPPQKEKSVYQK